MSGALMIIALIAFISACVAAFSARNIGSFIGGGFFGGLISGIVVSFVMLVFATEEGKFDDSKLESSKCVAVYEIIPLISIEREQSMSGTFFIGSGTVKSDVYYFAYVDTSDGMYLNKYPRYKTYIVEQDGEPKATTTMYECSRPVFAWLKGMDKAPKRTRAKKYQLYVPKGTIIRDFKL